MISLPCVRFRHRSVIEMVPLAHLLTTEEWQLRIPEIRERAERAQQERGFFERESAINYQLQTGPRATTTHLLGDFGYTPGWYGIESSQPVCVQKVTPWWRGVRLEFNDAVGAIVPSEVVATTAGESVPIAVPTRLQDATLTAALVDPVKVFFHSSEETGFWERIVSDSRDELARCVYADWLDDHNAGYGWVFREGNSFRHNTHELDWAGVLDLLSREDSGHGRAVWEYTRMTNRGVWVPYTLADRSAVPQFIVYLLAVSSIRGRSSLLASTSQP